MTFIIMGNVLSVELNTCTVRDVIGGETYTIHIAGESILDIKAGSDGIFIGEYVRGIFKAKKVEVSKFLNALYEEDLFDLSGSFNLVSVINDPFPEIFQRLSKESSSM